MLIQGQARPLLALAVGLLVAQQATATSLSKTGSSRPQAGVSKLEVEGELTGVYSKPSLNTTAIDAIDAALWEVLPAVPSRVDPWRSGLLPLNCAAYHAESPSVSPGFDFDVYNVTYNDCGIPWIFCRHVDAQRSIEDMTEMFGKLPIRMRELVRTVVAIPAAAPEDDWWDAFSAESDIIVRPGGWQLRLLAHEAAHIVDAHYASPNWRPPYSGPKPTPGSGSGVAGWLRRHARGWPAALHKLVMSGDGGGGGDGELYSSTERWREAERRDAAVATPYSLTNWVEHFAEMAGPGLLEAARGPGAVAAAVGREAADGLSAQIEVWNTDWGFLAGADAGGGQGVGETGCDVRERLPPVEVIHNVL
ncbi:hypothetical protein RB597_005067 [Gaeumannomyces tritici]